MKPITDYIKKAHKEQHMAKKYAEKYVMCKAENNAMRAKTYHDMALQSLEHAEKIHRFMVEDIDRLKEKMEPTYAMSKEWDEAHKNFVDRDARIKQMLAM